MLNVDGHFTMTIAHVAALEVSRRCTI